MADTRLTDQQVADLEGIIRNDAATADSKVQYINTIKSGIKQHNVPETCIPPLFEGLRGASNSPHAIIASAGFTALNHLFTRMSRQEPKVLAKEAPRTLALVVEKLGDHKEKIRVLAHQSLNTFNAVAPADVERFVRNVAMVGKNSRTKEAAMHWLLEAHNDQGVPFRSYVPTLMDLLEDADGMVRDTAKNTVIELFKNAPNAAKSDLKRQLKNFQVRPAIEQAIVKALIPTRSETLSDPPPPPPPAASRTLSSTSSTAAAAAAAASQRPTTPSADTPSERVDPMYVNTNRELDDTMRDMVAFFDGKESEHNWLKREQSIAALRRLLVGNAPADYHDTLVAGLRTLLDGIIKAITSLRTSLSKEGCSLVQEMAVTLGPGIDPLVELLMQTLLKLSAGTKKISSQMANAVVEVILGKVTYTPRLMQHIWGACQDKNVQPRLYCAGWLQTILKKEAHHRHHIEHTGGLDLMEKCIRKSLADPNPGVREKMRSTFWIFWSVWPARADAIMADLDATAQKLLNKDPNNPNASTKPEAAARGSGPSKGGAGRPSIREHMMAQKRANLAPKNLPPRPGSAMANLSPVRKEPAVAPPRHVGARPRPESTYSATATMTTTTGGMSGAPMRPARRRPEVTRPATAGPYSVRDQPSTEAVSPESLRPRNAPPPNRPQHQQTTPVRGTSQTRPGYAPPFDDASPISPSRSPVRLVTSPRVSPLKYSRSSIPVSSPSRPASARAYEELSLMVPAMSRSQVSSPRSETSFARPVSRQPSPAPLPPAPFDPPKGRGTGASPRQVVQVYEDPFTEGEQQEKTAPGALANGPPVLEERPVNEDAAMPPPPPPSTRSGKGFGAAVTEELASPDKTGQNTRLLDSGIAKIKNRTLEVHGFRKMQSLIRDSRTVLTDQRFETLVVGLFQFLEDPLAELPADRAQDVKAQILTTLKLLLRRERDSFRPHVSRGLEALLQTRGRYDTRAHVVSGLELLADELVALGDGAETLVVLARRLEACSDAAVEGCRTLSMGLHVLRTTLDKRPDLVPWAADLALLAALAGRCLDSTDSGVRMDAVQFCVALHDRVGDAPFWHAMAGVKDDPKSLITYYIVKKQRETQL